MRSVASPGQITVTLHLITSMSANRRVAFDSRARDGATWSLTSIGSMGSVTEPKAKRSRPSGSIIFGNKRGPVASALVSSPDFQNA